MPIRIRKRALRRKPGRRAKRVTRARIPKPNTTVFRSPNVIPDVLVGKFPYSQTKSMLTSTSPVSVTFRNSMFDPDYTGAGHQPFMRDQIAPLYTKYLCYGFRYEITFTNTSPTVPVIYVVAPFNHSGSPSTIDLAREKPYSRSGILTTTSSKGTVTLRGFFSAPRALGVSKKVFGSEKNYWANVGSNPTQEAYLTLSAIAVDSTSSVTVYATVRLQLYTKFFDREIVSSS